MGNLKFICYDCGNKKHFHMDPNNGEVVCKVCGIVIGRKVFRCGYFMFEEGGR